jgi:ectoine hydroxylase
MTRGPAAARNTTPVPMTAEQRAAFDRDGYLIIRGALRPDEAAAAREAVDHVYTYMAKAGSRALT